MIELIVAAVILIVIMLLFVFILFKNIMKNMNENAKKYFVNKLQDYDYILEEKQTELEEIREEINQTKIENKNILEKTEDVQPEIKRSESQENQPAKEIKYNLNTPDYRETQFFNNYKELKRIFTVDNEKIIKDFIKDHKSVSEEKEYKSLQKLRNKFDNDAIYGCLTLNSREQIEVLDQILTATEKKLVNYEKTIKNNDKFTIKDFIKYIDNRMHQTEPTIYIYIVGSV